MSDGFSNPWPSTSSRPGGEEYAARHAAQRLLQDRLTGAALPAELERQVADTLTELNELLASHQVAEGARYDAMRVDLPGRGHPLLPPYVVDEVRTGAIRGRVTFSRFHLGGGAAVHGGVAPLLFDDVLGRVANDGYDTTARTAYLKTDYRQVTPLDVELFWDVSLDRVEGRKRFATGRLTDAGGAVLAEAQGLFIELLPGQP